MPANQRLIVIAALVVVCALGFVVAMASRDSGTERQLAPLPTVTTGTVVVPPPTDATITTRENGVEVITAP